jgi:hypothetical protein
MVQGQNPEFRPNSGRDSVCELERLHTAFRFPLYEIRKRPPNCAIKQGQQIIVRQLNSEHYMDMRHSGFERRAPDISERHPSPRTEAFNSRGPNILFKQCWLAFHLSSRTSQSCQVEDKKSFCHLLDGDSKLVVARLRGVACPIRRAKSGREPL